MTQWVHLKERLIDADLVPRSVLACVQQTERNRRLERFNAHFTVRRIRKWRERMEKPNPLRGLKKTTAKQLVRHFGLTEKQAKCWLENEPVFTPRKGE